MDYQTLMHTFKIPKNIIIEHGKQIQHIYFTISEEKWKPKKSNYNTIKTSQALFGGREALNINDDDDAFYLFSNNCHFRV